jgi:tetratricopeptide (TPR) repeat protein
MKETKRRRESLNHALDVLAPLGDDENAPDQVILSRVRILREMPGRDPANHLANAQRSLRLLQSVTSRIENADKELAECKMQVGVACFQAADYSQFASEKERCYRQALEQFEQVAQIYKRRVTVAPTIENRSDLASAYLNHGAAHGKVAQLLVRVDATREEGIRIEEAKLKIETIAVELMEALANENPMVVDFRNTLAILYNNIVESHMRMAVTTRAYDRLEEAMRFALRAGEVVRRIQTDFPMYSTAVQQGESGILCLRIAQMALRSTEFSNDRKRQFFEVAMDPILQMDARLRTPLDRINCAKMALSGTQIPDLKAEQRVGFLEPVIDLLLEVSVDQQEASELGMLGQMLYQVGRYEESRRTLEECIKLHGDVGPTVSKGVRWWYIAMFKARSGESDEAQKLWLGLSAEAKTLGQTNLKIRREVGDLIGMDDAALDETDSQALDRMMAANISNWRVFLLLGRRIQQSGGGQDSERAFAAAAELLQQVPEEKRAIADWTSLALALYESGQYAEAQWALERRFAARPETEPTIYGGPRWWYHALLLARSGEYAQAHDLYNILTGELASHPTPGINERHRKELATLLGITDPPPYSLEGIAASSVLTGQNHEESSGQISDPSFDPIVANPEYKPDSGPVVRIDEGHRNFQTIGGRFAGFAKLVRRDGYRVDRHLGRFTVDALSNVDVLVIANARSAANDDGGFSAFDADETEQLFEWVSAGGSLLLIADHAPFGSASMDLAKRLGIEMTNSIVADLGKRPPMIFHRNVGLASHPITDGRSVAERVDRVATFTGQAFQIAGDAVPLLQFGEDATMVVMKQGTGNQVVERRAATGFLQGVVLEVGKGRVAVFGEAAMFSAQVIGSDRIATGMNSPLAPDNQQFLLNMMHWLTHRL